MGGSSGSETGDPGSGGNPAGSGYSNMVAAGVTMQIVYYRYDESYNRVNSHANVVSTLQSGSAIPWNATGKDIGAREATVFDTFTVSPHTFLVKAYWNSYPYVYRLPANALAADGSTFYWSGFANYWFNYNNPGGKASTSPYIVRNDSGGSYAIEQFLARIILGNSYGDWDKLNIAAGETAAADSSLYASVLRYLGASEQAVQNYLDAYNGKLSITRNGSTLIPTLIWSWVGAETLNTTNRLYTIGDVAKYGSSNGAWLQTPYVSPAAANAGYGACAWMKSSTDTMICKLMLGGTHNTRHSSTIWKDSGSSNLFGTGFVNRIQSQVDATAEDGTNTFYYLRGYWTPYGAGSGSISLTKTNVSGSARLAGAEFTLYRDAACTSPVTSADYENLNSSDTGFVSASVRSTNASGFAQWTGLYTGTYFLKETKAPAGYRVNVDAAGNVAVHEVSVSRGTANVTLTNAENAGPITLQKSINAVQACIDGIAGNPNYSLAGAEYAVSQDGNVVETLITDADGKAVSARNYGIGTVLTIQETKAPAGFLLDTRTYTLTVGSGENLITVADIPSFDPPFVLTKVDRVTTTPQGDGSFRNAVFKWEFYENTDWSGVPARTWYFRTDANGRCLYAGSYFSADYTSDALYVSPAGAAQLPLGSVKITEVQSSYGYAIFAEPLYCTITMQGGRARHTWTEGSLAALLQVAGGDFGVWEPLDAAHFGSVILEKYDAVTGRTPQGEATLAGAVFEILNSSAHAVKIGGNPVAQPGEVCCTLTTDESGYAEITALLPFGTYTIREAAAPTGYLRNTAWSKTFSVTPDRQTHSFRYANNEGCPDTVISGQIEICKVIRNPVDGSTAPEANAKFEVVNAKGAVVDTVTTGTDGIARSKALPYGTYSVRQAAGASGTDLCPEWNVTIRENGKVLTYQRENPLWTAAVSIHKAESGTTIPLTAAFRLCQRLPDGTVNVLETGTTDNNGNLRFMTRIVYADGICNRSRYFIRETAAPMGYVPDQTEYPIVCTSRNQVISLTIENQPIYGRIELRKQSSMGDPMQGVKFLLETSLDKQSWRAVTAEHCTGEALAGDGTLLTDVHGIAQLERLRVFTHEGKPIYYRITELATLNGASLMPDHIWEGDLTAPKEDGSYAITLGVVNSPVLELPKAGSMSVRLLPMAAALFAFAGTAVLLTARRKEKP